MINFVICACQVGLKLLSDLHKAFPTLPPPSQLPGIGLSKMGVLSLNNLFIPLTPWRELERLFSPVLITLKKRNSPRLNSVLGFCIYSDIGFRQLKSSTKARTEQSYTFRDHFNLLIHVVLTVNPLFDFVSPLCKLNPCCLIFMTFPIHSFQCLLVYQ